MVKRATITIKDEVNIQIAGLLEHHIQHFYDAYGIHTESYFHHPKYKLGAWDGKIRYFKKDGTTFYHLLEEIMPKIVALGYEVKLNDQREGIFVTPPIIDKDYFSHIIWPDTDEPVELYEHQINIINTLTQTGNGIAIAATGAGKTLCCGAVCKLYNDLGLNMIIIVPSQDLIEQTRDDLKWLQLDVGEYSGARKELNHKTIVSTWQALQNNPTILNNMQGVIVDEAHGLTGQVLKEMLLTTGGKIAHRFGVTGTLPKGKVDAFSVVLSLGPVRVTVTAKELIDLGVLAKLDIHIHQYEEDFTEKYVEFVTQHKKTNPTEKPPTYQQFKDKYFPEYQPEKEYLMKNKERIAVIAERITEVAKQGNTFVLVDGVDYGKKLAASIEGAVFLHGKDKVKVRKEIYKLFKTEDNLIVLATVNIASTGINIKRIYNLFLVDIGKSFTRTMQSIGRGLRVAPDKDHVDIYDICSDLKYSRKHLSERVKYYNEAQYPHNKKTIDYKEKLKQYDDI